MSRLGQIKQTFKSVRIEIKAFLRRQQWKEALIFFCFILLAFGFWLLQSLQQEYEIDSGQVQECATGYIFHRNTARSHYGQSERQRECIAELLLRSFVCPN